MQFEFDYNIGTKQFVVSVDATYHKAVTKDKHLANCPDDLFEGWELNHLTTYNEKGNIVIIEVDEEVILIQLEKHLKEKSNV